jgi:hypothetical protein
VHNASITCACCLLLYEGLRLEMRRKQSKAWTCGCTWVALRQQQSQAPAQLEKPRLAVTWSTPSPVRAAKRAFSAGPGFRLTWKEARRVATASAQKLGLVRGRNTSPSLHNDSKATAKRQQSVRDIITPKHGVVEHLDTTIHMRGGSVVLCSPCLMCVCVCVCV